MFIVKDCNSYIRVGTEAEAENALLQVCMAEGCNTNKHYWTEEATGKTKFIYKYVESITAAKGL